MFFGTKQIKIICAIKFRIEYLMKHYNFRRKICNFLTISYNFYPISGFSQNIIGSVRIWIDYKSISYRKITKGLNRSQIFFTNQPNSYMSYSLFKMIPQISVCQHYCFFFVLLRIPSTFRSHELIKERTDLNLVRVFLFLNFITMNG